MVFLGFTIYALDAYLLEGRRLIFALPAVHVLWANMHPSVIVTVVPFGAVLAAGAGLHLLRRWRGVDVPDTPSLTQLRIVAAVLDRRSPGLARQSAGHRDPDPAASSSRPRPGSPRRSTSSSARPSISTRALRARRAAPPHALVLVAALAPLGSGAPGPALRLSSGSPPCASSSSSPSSARPCWRATWPRSSRRGAASASAAPRWPLAAAGLVAVRGVGRPGAGPGAAAGRFAQERRARRGRALHSRGRAPLSGRIGMTGRLFNAFHFGGYIAWRDFPRRSAIIDGRGYVPPGLAARRSTSPGPIRSISRGFNPPTASTRR